MVTTSTLPKLRADLTIQPQRTSSGVVYVVKNPESSQYFRLGEVEEFISRQFDGETPLDAIRARVEEQYGATLDPETLNVFAKNLQAMGLLEGEGASSGRRSGRDRRVRGSILYLRFKLLDPTAIFNQIAPFTRFFFTPYFLILSAISIVLAADTIISQAGNLLQSFRALYGPSAVPLFVTFSLITVMLHEFGHGMTCRHFGGEVHEIGFLLVYFQPALYCNVSDAWLFPEKSKRLWVGFAGPYFELFLWSLAVFAWRFADEGTVVSVCALAVIGVSGVKTLFNFNPLIKLDGYYLLSDFLEIPNLRKKAFLAVGDSIARLFGKRRARDPHQTPRERAIYLIYGFTAAAGSITLIGTLFVAVLKQFGDTSQSALLVIPLAGGLFLRIRRWSSRLSGGTPHKSSAAAVDDEEESELETGSRARSGGEEPARSTRSPWTWLRRLAWVAALGLVIAVVLQRTASLRVKGAFNILPIDATEVRVSVDGLLDKVFVREGDRVKRGDLIAVLSDRELRASLEKTEAEIREAQAQLNMLKAGPTRQEIALAEAAVSKADGHTEYVQRKLERAKMLFQAGLVARAAYDDAEEQLTATDAEVREAKARLNALIHNVRPEQIAGIVAQIDRLGTERNLIRAQLKALQVFSPVAGVVGTPERQLLQMRQQLVRKGDSILRIYGFTKVKAQILISEKEIPVVNVGQNVELRARAHPLTVFRGKVNFIATSANDPSAVSAAGTATPVMAIGKSASGVLVESEIDNSSFLLKPEMTGQARIDCGRKRLYELLMWHFTRYLRVDSLSW